MRDCVDYQAWISALLDGELLEAEQIELRQHMAHCAECRGVYDAFARLDQGLAELAEAPPVGLHAAIMDRVRGAEQERRCRQRRRWLRPLLCSAACLVVILGAVLSMRFGFGFGEDTGSTETSIANAAGGGAEKMEYASSSDAETGNTTGSAGTSPRDSSPVAGGGQVAARTDVAPAEASATGGAAKPEAPQMNEYWIPAEEATEMGAEAAEEDTMDAGGYGDGTAPDLAQRSGVTEANPAQEPDAPNAEPEAMAAAESAPLPEPQDGHDNSAAQAEPTEVAEEEDEGYAADVEQTVRLQITEVGAETLTGVVLAGEASFPEFPEGSVVTVILPAQKTDGAQPIQGDQVLVRFQDFVAADDGQNVIFALEMMPD